MHNKMKKALAGLALATGLALGGTAVSSVAAPETAVSITSCHDQARVTGGVWLGYYQGMCPCGDWRGNKFAWWKPGAKTAAQGEVNWHKNLADG